MAGRKMPKRISYEAKVNKICANSDDYKRIDNKI